MTNATPCPVCGDRKRILVGNKPTGREYVDCGTCDDTARGWRKMRMNQAYLRAVAYARFGRDVR